MRGLYVCATTMAGFGDGQVISGGGDYAGKTFQVVKLIEPGYTGGAGSTSMVLVETSNTVETN